MGLDMYAYKMSLPAVEKYVLHLDQPVGDASAASFPARKAARYFVGFVDKTNEELQQMTVMERENYWTEQMNADRIAKEAGAINTEYHYWRKFNALHGWMEDLWRERVGAEDSEEFNCRTLRLFEQDLRKLRAEMNNLRPRGGFFFGSEIIFPEDLTSLTSFLDKAQEDVATHAIFYDSWW